MRPPNGNRIGVLLYIGIFFSMLVVGLFFYSNAFRWTVLLIYVPLLLLRFSIRGIPQWFKRNGRQIETLPHDALLSTTAYHSRPDHQRGRHDATYATPENARGVTRLDDDITIITGESGLDFCRLRPW